MTMSSLVYLWGPPRSLSTAFVRMMLERGDFTVVHEPFSSIVVAGYTVLGREKFSDPHQFYRRLHDLAVDTPVFVKETTEYRYSFVDDREFLSRGTHTFIIRDPRAVIPSHYAMNPKVTLAEVGFEHQLEIFRKVHEATGEQPFVLEAEQLTADPWTTVRRYCAHLGIPFIASALHWQPGDCQEWSRTAEWHRDVANSSGFSARARHYDVRVDNSRKLAGFYDYHRTFYEQLRSRANTAEQHEEPTGGAGIRP
ncbi:sulfotransferase family protein [Amycolatopsis lurida]